MVTDCLIDGQPMDGAFRVVRGDGTVRTLHMNGAPVLDEHGSTASLRAVLRDVTAAGTPVGRTGAATPRPLRRPLRRPAPRRPYAICRRARTRRTGRGATR
ncbi:hypothetical protein ACFQVA_39855 [Actinomadura keratinilytica]